MPLVKLGKILASPISIPDQRVMETSIDFDSDSDDELCEVNFFYRNLDSEMTQ